MLTYSKTSKSLLIFVCMNILFSAAGFSENAAAEDFTLSLAEIDLQKDETGTFGLSLSNKEVVEALQFRFTYAIEGFTITGVSLTSRTRGFESPVWQITPGEYGEYEVLIVLYSLQGATISPGTGDILMFHYRTASEVFGRSAVLFTETVLADTTAEELPAADSEDRILTMYGGFSAEFSDKSGDPSAAAPEVPVVPEPSTFILLAIGLFGLSQLARSRKKSLSSGRV